MTALGRAVTVVLVTLGLATLQGCDPAGEDADDAIGSDAAADAASEAPIPVDALTALASDATPITFTCVPWGSGVRIGLDRDLDGILNADE